MPLTWRACGMRSRMASTSSLVSENTLAAPMRTAPWRPQLGITSMRFEPSREMVSSSWAWVPWPTETMMITAAMPMITPRAVKVLRNQLPRSANTAM
jgi:hypothetical protein